MSVSAQIGSMEPDISRCIVSKLSEAKEPFRWYSLQLPQLSKLQPRVGHAIVSLEDGKILLIGGGNHKGALKEVVSINLEPSETGSEKEAIMHPACDSFPSRYEFLCTKDSDEKCVWIFGGADTENTSNDVIKIDHETVQLVKCADGIPPCPRTQGSSSALVDFQGRKCLAVFSGGLKGELPVQDRNLYLLDTAESKWQTVDVKIDQLTNELPFASQPPSVQGHVMTGVGSKILLHGGINNTTLYDGFHWIDFEKRNDDLTFSWVDSSLIEACPEKPSARAAHGIARLCDVEKNSPMIYMFGGIGEKGACKDLWSLNVESMCWNKITKDAGMDKSGIQPVPRLDFAMCAVGLANGSACSESSSIYIMIHGGMNREGEIFNDAWVMKVK